MTRAGKATAGSSALLFADFILDHEARHFDLEEALLLPALPADDRSRQLRERVEADHAHLRDAAGRLRGGEAPASVELVQSLGARLRAHVQLEERELFPYLEQTLEPSELKRIGAELEAR